MSNDTISIIIADVDKGCSQTLKRSFDAQPDMNVIYIAENGEDALKKIKDLKPDVVLLDIVMPYRDGLNVLKELNTEKNEREKLPVKIVLTSMNSVFALRSALSFGAHYYIIKPIRLPILIERIRELYRIGKSGEMHESRSEPFGNFYSKDLNDIISYVLMSFKISVNLKGYAYLIDCIKLFCESKDSTKSVTKEIYPEVAKMHNSTVPRVERAVRNAIEIAYKKAGEEQNQDIYNVVPLKSGKKKPSNKEFLANVAKYIKINEQKMERTEQ